MRPLLLACIFNNDPLIAELLLAAGASAAVTDSHGLNILHWLAQREAEADVLTPFVTLLCTTGAVLEGREELYGASALAWSGWHGRAGAAVALLQAGADVQSVDAFGGTPLHWAQANGHQEAAGILRQALEQAAPPTLRLSDVDVARVRRALQAKHGEAAEAPARASVRMAVALFSRAVEQDTGQHAPGPVRQCLMRLLMPHAFRLWPPTTVPV